MIRLVTQFDDVETHASLATPTCGGCSCCCCCCVASLISSSTLPALHVSALRQRQPEPERRHFTTGLALFALALTLVVSVVTVGYGFVVAPAVWAFLLWIAYRRAGAEHPIAWGILVAFLGSLAIVVEFFLALVMLDSLDAFAALGVIAGVLITVLGYFAIKVE